MSSTTIIPQPSFYGDYKKGEEPTNWLRKYELSLPTTATDTDKLSQFELQCAAASPAESWYASLPPTDKATWAAFRAAFKVRWPQPTQVTLTVAQKKEQDQGDSTEGGGDRRDDRGRGFNDSQCHLLDVVLDNTPEILCDLLADNYTSWTDFETDVAKVSALQLLRAKQHLAMDRKLHEDMDKLQNQTGRRSQDNAVLLPSNTSSLCHATTVQNQAAAPPAPPMFQPPTTLLTPQVPQTPQAAHLFAPAAPVTHGNLFYGYRGYPQTPSRRGGSPADHMRTAAQYTTIPHHPNSEASKQAYAQQIQEWHAQHGADAIPNSQRPYPLKPGTSPIGSRECFNCGLTTSPPHQAYDCTNEPVPTQETKWRETVSRLVSRTLAAPTTLGPTSNVQFIPNMAPSQYAIPQNPYPAPAAAYPQYSYFAEPYEMYHAMGNEFGPQHLPSVSTSAFTSLVNTSVPNTPAIQEAGTLCTDEADDDLIMPVIDVAPTEGDMQQISMLPVNADSSSFLMDLPFSESDFNSIFIPDRTDSPPSSPPHVENHSVADADTLSLWITIPKPVDHSTSTDSSFVTLSLVSTCESKSSSDCYLGRDEQSIVDLYAISDNDDAPSNTIKSTPFVTQIILYGPGAKMSCFQANVDDGAMIHAIDLKTFNKASKHLKKLTRSNRILRMANGTQVPSHGIWTGTFQWNKAKVHTSFKVFDGGSVWNVLIGKPLLEQLQAKHDYGTDTILIPASPQPYTIRNIANTPAAPRPKSSTQHSEPQVHKIEPVFLTITMPSKPKPHPRPSELLTATNEHFVFTVASHCTNERLEAYADVLSHAGAHVVIANHKPQLTPADEGPANAPCSPIEYPTTNTSPDTPGKDTPVWPVVEEPEEHNLGEIPEFLTPPSTAGVYSRHTNPFRTERVEEILRQIKIGNDLTQDQQAKSARSFQSTSRCSNSHFQKAQSSIRRLNKLETAGIIRRIAPEDVKAASPTVLAQKAHGLGSLPLEELLHCVNDQCATHGLPT
ncbi:hypothetical protein DFH29DRAFT_872228 [Suillus ampliporus]|nr:hypothetical protein DFH29DRAFT_872228 [Suillus ampliporus]